ncbi:hypothetical protein EV360DRAFT_82528 [Lentinula raphanica]|nr:hypothetical protein EV360DRAFT_82528 [Lentinula raphanica]
MSEISIRQDVLSTEIARIRGKPVVQIERVDNLRPTVLNVELEGGEHFIVRCENRLVFDPEEPIEVTVRRSHEHATILNTLRAIYHAPVPIVYHVEPDPNKIGAPWMLLERIPGNKLHFVASRWNKAGVRENNMRIVIEQYASIYTSIFTTPIPESLYPVLSEDNQHYHHDAMPAAFDVKLHYDDPPHYSVSSDILRARAYRQETATFLAHRFWSYMFDKHFCAETVELNGLCPELLPLLHKLRALIPVLLPSVEEYLKLDSSGKESLLGSRKLYHYDPSVSNIMVDSETAKITGIVDWELTMAVPALLAAVYPEWIRYDGQITPTSYWSSNLLQLSPDHFEYGKWRKMYEESVGRSSPDYLAALRSGKELRELLDWARFGLAGRPLDQRISVIEGWANEKAKRFGVNLAQVVVCHKKDWMP